VIKKRKLLILCSDNRWRSPLAHAVMRQYHFLDVCSAGFDDTNGHPPPRQMILTARDLGIEISGFRSTSIDPHMIEWADVFICVDAYTRASLKEFARQCDMHYAPRKNENLYLLGEWARPKLASIPDPVEARLKGDEIEEVIDHIVIASHILAYKFRGDLS
jgi:protein-tyrosine-phosphatase